MTLPLFSILAVVHYDELATLLPALVTGAIAVYVLLPRPQPYPSWIGILLGAAAVLLTGFLILRTGFFTVEVFLFYVFSAITVISGALLVTQRNPARAALAFALVILSTCGLFLLLAAPFLMAATIIIYAGAIIVTFLFVLMLAQQAGFNDADARSREPALATFTGFVLLGALVYILGRSYEKSDAVQALDQVLVRTRQLEQTASNLPPNELHDVSARLKEPLASLLRFPEVKEINDQIEDRVFAANNADELKSALAKLEENLLIARQQCDWVRPHSDPRTKLSNLSGPSANEPPAQLRYDPQGRPQMPADNPAYLGRSLFTDYLLPVELGGFLLLVAMIGSIVIAQRSPSGERTT